MTSERCLSPRGHKSPVEYGPRLHRAGARSWLLGDPPPVLSRPAGPYRRGENARTARHDSPLVSYGWLSVVKDSLIPPRCLTPYSCWTTPRSHMMPKGHRGSSCFLNPAVLGKQETSLEEPYARKSDHVCKKRDRPAYEGDRSANFRTGRRKGWADKAPKGLSTPGRREHEATATGKKAW